MDPILSGYLKDFRSEFNLHNVDDCTLFEDFTNYCIVKREATATFELEQLNIGKNGNPGIDGMAILLNGVVINEPNDVHYFINKKQSFDVDIIVTQAKTSPKFDSGDILKFIACAKNFLMTSDVEFKFNTDSQIRKEIISTIWENSINLRQPPTVKLYYVTTGRWENPTECKDFIDQEINNFDKSGYFKSISFIPIDAERIKTYYKEIKNRNEKEITFQSHVILPQIKGVDESYLGIIPSSEYIKIIQNSDGEIAKQVFYDNVRDFQGMNQVNRDIDETVKNRTEHSRFAIYNNGITIVAKSLRKIGTKFNLQDFQIVNGCQTSHIIHLNKSYLTDDMFIPIKIVVTSDYEATNNIIHATNSQTEVKSEAFESLKPFHKNLEEFFLAQNKLGHPEMHYERRSKQYDGTKINNNQVITIARLIKNYVAVHMIEPHNSHKYYGELLDYYSDSIFVESHSPEPYYLASLLCSKFEGLARVNNMRLPDKRLKGHLLACMAILLHDGKPLLRLAPKRFTEMVQKISNADIVLKAMEEGIEIVSDLANKWDSHPRNRHQMKAFTTDLVEEVTIRVSSRIPTPVQNVQTPKLSSTIKSYLELRGFGFIHNSPEDVFFHFTNVPAHQRTAIIPGAEVHFRIVKTPRGLEAKEIEIG